MSRGGFVGTRLLRIDRPARWRGWAAAATVYFLAVLHRTSLGVAGLQAEHRFSTGPGALSVFVFLQLGVYAAMQVPTGLLVDRFGPRRLLITAALVMGCAQLLFASVASYPAALAARGLLGCGDALTFVSVLRFSAAHFSPRRYPLLVALTAALGTVGNIVATLPLAVLLRQFGWQSTFTAAASLSFVAALGVVVLVPGGAPESRTPADWRQTLLRDVRHSWSLPGTRMGFWVHFSSMCTATAFGVLWGGVYLAKAARFSQEGAGAVLMSGVIVAAIAGPALGTVIARHPASRVPIALAVSTMTITGWVVAIAAFGNAPPRAFVIALFLVMMLGGPTSMAAFAIARDYNPAPALGTASGVVNVGGFLATIIIALGIGIALDVQGATTAHTLRYAVVVGLAVQAFGVQRLVTWFLRVRQQALLAQARGDVAPVRAVRRRWDLAVVPALDEGAAAASELSA